MSTSREKMQQARELITQKRYDDARAILRTVNHDTALDWLDKLDKLDPPQPAFSPKEAAATPRESAASLIDRGITANIVCINDRCRNKIPYVVWLNVYEQEFVCPKCGTVFMSSVVLVKAVRIETYPNGYRINALRIIGCDERERDLGFRGTLSFQPNDIAVFSRFKGSWSVVQNITTNRYILLASPQSKAEQIFLLLIVATIFCVVMFSYFQNLYQH
ncbi:MAG: hypothetical protein ABI947_02000 [Chloroflexota bacterium]